MLSTQEKLLEFQQSIQRELDRQISQINEDIESYRRTQMEAVEDEVLSDCYRTIQKAVAKIRLQYTTERAQALGEMKKKLLLRRDEYAGVIFGETRQRLLSFAASDEYPAYLRRKLQAAAEEYRPQKPVVFVREQDLPLRDVFTEILPRCEVRASADITIGGFIVEDTGKSYVINESLDSILEEQKEWFFSHSELRITQN